MDNRYTNIPTKVSDSGKRVVRSVLYPPIPRHLSDIYVRTTVGDRLDLLAKKYYNNVGYYWIIAQANDIGKGSLNIEIGIQLRIPKNISGILQDYANLNK